MRFAAIGSRQAHSASGTVRITRAAEEMGNFQGMWCKSTLMVARAMSVLRVVPRRGVLAGLRYTEASHVADVRTIGRHLTSNQT